jgi:hypothetical protein
MLKEVQILLAAKSFLGLVRAAVDTDVVRWQLAPFYAQPRWAFIACDRILCRAADTTDLLQLL